MADEHDYMTRELVQNWFREYASLDRRRTGEGLTPIEYQRWLDLHEKLSREFSDPPASGDRRGSVRVPIKLKVEFRSNDSVRRAIIRSTSRSGLFINTPFPPEVGTTITLCIHIESTGETIEVPCDVISNNVGEGFDTNVLGMGVCFRQMPPDVRKQLDEIYGSALASEDD
ncbi:MAG: PilZ domain-containing protein [Proteobacteria bacterium]|nr:PilZ domain-containing protein [Pseudomonadota bacterium]